MDSQDLLFDQYLKNVRERGLRIGNERTLRLQEVEAKAAASDLRPCANPHAHDPHEHVLAGRLFNCQGKVSRQQLDEAQRRLRDIVDHPGL